jgi:hypothetical protein
MPNTYVLGNVEGEIIGRVKECLEGLGHEVVVLFYDSMKTGEYILFKEKVGGRVLVDLELCRNSRPIGFELKRAQPEIIEEVGFILDGLRRVTLP